MTGARTNPDPKWKVYKDKEDRKDVRILTLEPRPKVKVRRLPGRAKKRWPLRSPRQRKTKRRWPPLPRPRPPTETKRESTTSSPREERTKKTDRNEVHALTFAGHTTQNTKGPTHRRSNGRGTRAASRGGEGQIVSIREHSPCSNRQK